jgi:hypothetical protein
MARQDKVLDILALAGLPEHVKLAKLARRWIGKPFNREQAKAVVKCYLDPNGRLPALTQALIDEKLKQERLRNERTAYADAAKKAAESPLNKYKGSGGARLRRARALEIAKRTFGPHVRDNFNEDTLALMSLIDGEDRWYQVKWLDAGFKPVRSTLIEVVTMRAAGGSLYSRFLLYQTNGRVLVARTPARSLEAAWGSQLPQAFVEGAGLLAGQGYTFRSDLEDQSLVVVGPDGEEARRVLWSGRTVDE